ncbi:hypothetical protein PIB30_084887 [Stylosanthes scabra]|uniref:Uncharacterized protein n=1 Tax=Stylosanthes scabra TaxID=79078 RepID=A0ABU6QT71_9FABA|nr:hypothetical protein [Stylosanthes scabra]
MPSSCRLPPSSPEKMTPISGDRPFGTWGVDLYDVGNLYGNRSSQDSGYHQSSSRIMEPSLQTANSKNRLRNSVSTNAFVRLITLKQTAK